VEAIKIAEDHSSGEIRVHIDSRLKMILPKKRLQFSFAGYASTKERNAFCFMSILNSIISQLLATKVFTKSKQQFWDTSRRNDLSICKENYYEGLKEAILKTGLELKKYFPVDGENINELSNDISFS
jgi:uncharacterized membrane protein